MIERTGGLSELDDLLLSDHETKGQPVLPLGSRDRVQEGLERIVVNRKALDAHIRVLRQRLGRELRHDGLLSAQLHEAVLGHGLDVLDDVGLAVLALSPFALCALHDALYALEENIPPVWLEAMGREGRILIERRDLPSVREMTQQARLLESSEQVASELAASVLVVSRGRIRTRPQRDYFLTPRPRMAGGVVPSRAELLAQASHLLRNAVGHRPRSPAAPSPEILVSDGGELDGLAECLDAGYDVVHLLRPPDRQATSLLRWTRDALYLLDSDRGRYRPYVLPATATGIAPGHDLVIVPEIGAIESSALTPPEEQVRNRFTPTSSEGFKLLHEQFATDLAHADPLWTAYHCDPGWDSINLFSDAILQKEKCGGVEMLVLDCLSSTLIPADVLEKRLARIRDELAASPDFPNLQHVLSTYAHIAEQRRRLFVQRLREHSVRHIACKETIQNMVRGDWCSTEHPLFRFGRPAFLTADEGKAAVRTAVRLLSDYPNFHLALTERADATLFSSFWKVIGGKAVILETWREARGQAQVNLVIRAENVAAAFGEHFNRSWDRLTEHSDRGGVIAWLEGLLSST